MADAGTPGTPASAQTSPAREDNSRPAATNPVAIENVGPDRMHALSFTVDAAGVRLTKSVNLSGRVKAPPVSHAPHRIEFEVYDAGGRKIYEGSLNHPLHRWAEHADADGRLRGVQQDLAEDAFLVRVPGDLPAARIALFEIRPDLAARTELGNFPLP